MKHYKEGRNHIFEFGEMSITRIKLKPSQYDELADYFAQQYIKNCPMPAAIKSLPEYNEILYHAKTLSDEQFREYWNELQGNVL